MSEAFKKTVRAAAGKELPLSVTYSGHQKCEASHGWGKGVRDRYILHLIVSGKGVYSTPEGDFSLGARDAFLIRPYTEIEYRADENDPWEYYWVNFTGPDAEIILNKTDFSPRCPVIHGCGKEIAEEMENILSVRGTEDHEKLELTGRLYILLSLIAAVSERSRGSASEDHTRGVLKTAVDFIATNYPLPLSVEDIAEAAGVSRTTLFRMFRSEMSVSPVDFLIEYRIGQAKKLLAGTELSVSAVARSSGYEDSLYFSRAFRKITGMTPTEYRKSK